MQCPEVCNIPVKICYGYYYNMFQVQFSHAFEGEGKPLDCAVRSSYLDWWDVKQRRELVEDNYYEFSHVFEGEGKPLDCAVRNSYLGVWGVQQRRESVRIAIMQSITESTIS